MTNEPPNKCRVAIVGGGVIGCSIAYHLGKIGWEDTVVLERKQLTCGTTWHAAGLIGQLRPTQNMTKLAKYSAELFAELEQETGQATGFKQNGAISIATSEERMEELSRGASMSQVFGLTVNIITPSEVKELYPLLHVDDLVGAIHIPSDGQANPIDVTQALAKGARMQGVRFFEDTLVEKIAHNGEKVTGIHTNKGKIDADFVVLATGMWTRELAKHLNVNVPLHACEHFYIVTEPFEGVVETLPVLRDYDASSYYKEDAGKILLGAFERRAKPWGMEGIPNNFCFDELPEDFDHFHPILEKALNRMPALREVGIQKFFCGPESFTPDNRYSIGETPEIKGLFVAAGFNSMGIQSAGGVGKVVADWLRDGYPAQDYWEVDIRRNMPFQSNALYLKNRVAETLGLLYAMHWPFHQPETSRGIRRSALHHELEKQGACFGEDFGWERPNWFAPKGTEAKYQYSFKRQNWFKYSAKEHESIRTNVGVIDMSSFAKFRLQGLDSEKVLNRISANNVSIEPNRIIYTQWLNDRGGIEADLTITRLCENDYLILTSAQSQVRDFEWLNRHISSSDRAIATDVTSGFSIISVMGPRSRELLQLLTPEDLSNKAFPFGCSREIDFAMARVRASRISYVGELGWEISMPTEFAVHVFNSISDEGTPFGLKQVGLHAMNSLRIEKAFRHWGHDITDEDSPIEAGLEFAVSWDKPGGFVGRDSLVAQKKAGVKRRLAQFRLLDPEPLLYHNEPIWRSNKIVGYISSGMFGHSLGGAIGLGYVCAEHRIEADWVLEGEYKIEIAGDLFEAEISLKPMYDPKAERIKS